MPIIPDATALIALGAGGLIDLLPQRFGDVYVGRHVHAEARTAAAAIQAGIDAGWVRLEAVDDARVMDLQTWSGLDEGECEVILLAERLHGAGAVLVIDEGSAFEYVLRMYPMFRLRCLGHVLYELEAAGLITSWSQAMDGLISDGHYRWAPDVRRHFRDWFGRQPKPPRQGP